MFLLAANGDGAPADVVKAGVTGSHQVDLLATRIR